MDSTPKAPKPDPDDEPQAQRPVDPDATIRTPDGDVTIHTPGPVPVGDTTFRLSNPPTPEASEEPAAPIPTQPGIVRTWDATVRPTSVQRPSGPKEMPPPMASPAKPAAATSSSLVKATLTAVFIALLLSLVAYIYLLNSKITLETAQRQQAQASLDQAATLAVAMREELEQARRDLEESTQRLNGLAALKDLVAQREMEAERLRAQIEEKEKELVLLYKTASPRDETLAMLQSASVRVIPLAHTDVAKGAEGMILYDATRGTVLLYAYNMPALPRGLVYQLWAVTTTPVSAGTFKPDTGRKGRLFVRKLPRKSRITRFDISVEPAGGKPQPTGAIYLYGSL